MLFYDQPQIWCYQPCSTKAIAHKTILFPINAYSATVFSFYTKFRNKSQPNSFVFLQ